MNRSIQQILARINPHTAGDVLIATLIVLVGVTAFGLGRLSVENDKPTNVSFSQVSLQTEPELMTVGGLLVASRQGSAYHFPWCAGAQAMNEENRIWFESEEAARAAGYRPAGNCPGLEEK